MIDEDEKINYAKEIYIPPNRWRGWNREQSDKFTLYYRAIVLFYFILVYIIQLSASFYGLNRSRLFHLQMEVWALYVDAFYLVYAIYLSMKNLEEPDTKLMIYEGLIVFAMIFQWSSTICFWFFSANDYLEKITFLPKNLQNNYNFFYFSTWLMAPILMTLPIVMERTTRVSLWTLAAPFIFLTIYIFWSSKNENNNSLNKTDNTNNIDALYFNSVGLGAKKSAGVILIAYFSMIFTFILVYLFSNWVLVRDNLFYSELKSSIVLYEQKKEQELDEKIKHYEKVTKKVIDKKAFKKKQEASLNPIGAITKYFNNKLLGFANDSSKESKNKKEDNSKMSNDPKTQKEKIGLNPTELMLLQIPGKKDEKLNRESVEDEIIDDNNLNDLNDDSVITKKLIPPAQRYNTMMRLFSSSQDGLLKQDK